MSTKLAVGGLPQKKIHKIKETTQILIPQPFYVILNKLCLIKPAPILFYNRIYSRCCRGICPNAAFPMYMYAPWACMSMHMCTCVQKELPSCAQNLVHTNSICQRPPKVGSYLPTKQYGFQLSWSTLLVDSSQNLSAGREGKEEARMQKTKPTSDFQNTGLISLIREVIMAHLPKMCYLFYISQDLIGTQSGSSSVLGSHIEC